METTLTSTISFNYFPFIITVIILFFYVSLFIGIIWLLKRNSDVCDFRNRIIDVCNEYNTRHILEYDPGNEKTDALIMYQNLPTYQEMVFSFKPLKIENYLTEEQIQILLN